MGRWLIFLIAKCIDEYIAVATRNDTLEHSSDHLDKGAASGDFVTGPEQIDPRLQDIVERMFRKCYEEDDYMPAIGIAIEARRLDVVREGIELAGKRSKTKGKAIEGEKDMAVDLMEYVLEIAMGEVQEISLRERVCLSVRGARSRNIANGPV